MWYFRIRDSAADADQRKTATEADEAKCFKRGMERHETKQFVWFTPDRAPNLQIKVVAWVSNLTLARHNSYFAARCPQQNLSPLFETSQISKRGCLRVRV